MDKAACVKVSVVIPTWTRSDLLERCLAALREQSFTAFKTVLVSNGAGDRVSELAAEYGCAVVRFPQNRGFAAAINAGLAAAHSSYVLLLNDDVELDRCWLERTTTLLDERLEISFCTGKIYCAQGTMLDNAGDALSMAGSAWRLGFGRQDSPEFDCPRPLLAVSATAALFRRAVFEQLGGFDEDFLSYLEDVDFSLRMVRAGLQGLYWPQAIARHHGGATLGGADSREVFELVTRNQVLLLAKHYPWKVLVRLSPRILWAQSARAFMAARKGMILPFCRGMLRGGGRLPRAIQKRHRWTALESQGFWNWLRDSESAIYEDMPGDQLINRDTFWRMYFGFFGTRRGATATPKGGLEGVRRSQARR